MSTRKLQKARTRARIIEAAAELFRRDGYSATGIDAVMERAGLTAGGFYAHFRSKSQLLAEALQLSLHQGKAAAGGDLEAFLDFYLSPAHRDHPERGCPLAGLAAELAREGAPVRRAVATHLETLAAGAGGRSGRARQQTLSAVSTLVGALLLARMSKGEGISDEILASARSQLRHSRASTP